jgi:hypothetical protein
MWLVSYRDFTLTELDELGVEVEADYIKGHVSLYGNFAVDKMTDIVSAVAAALKLICGCDKRADAACSDTDYRVVTEPVMDINTYGQEWIGLVINYWILPPEGGDTICADQVVVAGSGGTAPPFTAGGGPPEPLFRKLVRKEFSMNEVLSSININDPPWELELPWPLCETGIIIMPVDMPTIPPQLRSNLACGDFENSAGAGLALAALNQQKWSEPANLCDFQFSPCLCSYVPGCAWKNITGGSMRCRTSNDETLNAGESDVMCKYCRMQEKCPVSDAEICASRTTPCQCAQAAGADCKWDLGKSECRVRILDPLEDKTHCSACPLQWRCDLPNGLFREVLPKAGLTLPSPDWGSTINLTFDRQMRFQLGPTGRLKPNAVTFVCRMPPPFRPILHSVGLHRLTWMNTTEDINIEGSPHGQIMNIDVNGTENEHPTDCDLVVSEYAVEDLQNIPYLGLSYGAHTFGLQDTMSPALVKFDPPIGEINLPLNAAVTFVFNEQIRPGQDLRVLLYGFGGEASNAFMKNNSMVVETGADQVLGAIEFDDNAYLSDGKSIRVSLDGFLRHETLYSLALMPNSANDVSENAFGGFPAGTYLFRTAVRKYFSSEVVDSDDDGAGMMSQPGTIFIVVGLAFLWMGSMAGCFLAFRVRAARMRVADHVAAQDPAVLVPRKGPVWDGNFLHGQIDAGSDTVRKDLEQNVPQSPKALKERSSPTGPGKQVKHGTPVQRKTPAQGWRVGDVGEMVSPTSRKRAFEDPQSPAGGRTMTPSTAPSSPLRHAGTSPAIPRGEPPDLMPVRTKLQNNYTK